MNKTTEVSVQITAAMTGMTDQVKAKSTPPLRCEQLRHEYLHDTTGKLFKLDTF